jgi:hypothetical protein
MQFRLVLVALLVAVALASTTSASTSDAIVKEQFDDFVGRFGKQYASADEYEHRLSIFTRNLARIAALNAKYAVRRSPAICDFESSIFVCQQSHAPDYIVVAE